jgi:hypothetical protein
MAITFLDGLITSGDLTVSGGDIVLGGTGRIQGVDTVSVNKDAANKLYVDNAIAGVPQGDITGVTAGTGLSGGGNSGTVTLNLDLGELATGGTLIATDYLIAENGGVDNRQLISSIPLSIFNNNAGWTSNTGDITGVTAGTGLSGGGTSGTVTLTNSGVTQIIAGTNVTISPSGGTGNVTINASGGGGSGTIGGTIENQEIAVGTASDTIGGLPQFTWTPQSGLQVGNNSSTQGNTITINRPSGQPGRFLIKEGSTTEFLITTGGDTTMSTNTNDLILTDDTTAKVAIGNVTPYSKLSVDGGVQIGDDQATGLALASKVGTFRYYEVISSNVKASYSYVDMVMRTGTSSYAWINIVTNNW